MTVIYLINHSTNKLFNEVCSISIGLLFQLSDQCRNDLKKISSDTVNGTISNLPIVFIVIPPAICYVSFLAEGETNFLFNPCSSVPFRGVQF